MSEDLTRWTMAPERSIADIDQSIAIAEGSLSLYPRYHLEHFTRVFNLANARWARYKLSQEKEDVDKSIVHCTEAIFLPPVSVPGTSSTVVGLLFHLTCALRDRSDNFGQPRDIKHAIEYLRYLRGLPLDSVDLPRNIVTTSLIRSLAIQIKQEAGDVTSNIKEMVVLCRELLTSNLSADFPVSAFLSLNEVVDREGQRGRSVQSLDEVIECLRDAVEMGPPGSYKVLFALANLLRIRFVENPSKGDYEDAMALFERILDTKQPGKCPDSIRQLASSQAASLAFARSVIYQIPQDSETTISRFRTLLGSSSIDEGLRLETTRALEMMTRARFVQYSLAESLEESNSYSSQVYALLSAQNREECPATNAVRESYSTTKILEKIQHLEEQLSITPPGTERHNECLRHIADWYQSKFDRTNDISDIEESIKYNRLSVEATHLSSDHWHRKMVSRFSLYETLVLAFKETNKIGNLDELIDVCYDIFNLKGLQHFRFGMVRRLVLSLLKREELLGGTEDRREAIRLMSIVVDDEYAQEPDRFLLACRWAIVARSISHPTTLAAYKSAMSLVQRSLSFAPTVSIQHTRLVAMGKDCQTMPLDYASFRIHLGQFEDAVVALETGRALIWSEMRGLRTPIAQLIQEDPPLANRFAEINQELETLIISVTPSGRPELEDGVAQDRDGTDPFCRLVVKRQTLVEERDALISQIRGKPGFEEFLKTPSFTTLRSAASRGPVILINHCKWRSDILIIFHSSLPCSIPTADDFYDRANKLRDKLVEARKHGLDSDEYQDALCSVLKDLYVLVGEPVIKRLRVLGVPEQSRIWWCPTSVFCSLPLHAMGPIPSNDASERYFSDMYIPSYTPSLSALIESRKEGKQMLEKPSLLLVAQPDDSLPGVKGEIKVIRKLKSQVAVVDLVSSEATPSSVVEGLRSSHFAHFACHGALETGKPFEASFKLYGDSRLTLLDIARSRLPDAGFAFLSCCHAAEITEESVADEALHLTAAMQYCGFRSVVGTMWEMADTDGRDLAKSFYESLLSSQEAGVPYYERSARALRNATQTLRRKRGVRLERWVNFVHYGA